MSIESFQNLVEIVFFFYGHGNFTYSEKKMEIGISAQIMQGNLDHQGATEK